MAYSMSHRQSWIPWFLLVLVVAVALRAALWIGYPAASYHDSGGYRRLAQAALSGWRDFDGTRPPLYPLWMALVGPDRLVYLSQLLMGLAVTLLIFFLASAATRSWGFGAAAALAHTLNLGQLFFEASLLSETLTTFWLTLAFGCVYLALRPGKHQPWLTWLGAGVFAALAGLTRFLFLFLPFWIGLFLALAMRPQNRLLPGKEKVKLMRFNWRPLLTIGLTGIVLIGVWVSYIHSRWGIYAVSTLSGYQIVQHTGQWFELLPDEYAPIRDTFLKYRQVQVDENGTPANAIWDAIPELQQVTGLGSLQLGALLNQLSVQLIAEHPGLYLASVLDGWQLFWRAPVYWRPTAVSSASLRSVLQGIVTAERVLLVGFNLAFLLGTGLALVWPRFRARLGLTPWWTFVALTIWLTSLVQALPDHGDNPRFLVPLQSWVVVWVLWAGWCWIRHPKAENR